MANRWTICDLAEDELDALEAEGIRPTAQDVLAIQALALEAMGDFDDGARLHGAPVTIGDVVLWPPTIAGCIWREEVEAKLDANDYYSRLFVLAYSLAFGRDKDALNVFGRDALKAVLKWARGLRFGVADLAAAVNEVMGDRPRVPRKSDTDDADESAPAELAEIAMATFGGNPDVWRYQLGISEVIGILRRRRALKSQGNPVERRKTEAMRDLAIYVDSIRKRGA